MAFTDLGSLGATGSTANNQTTLDLTTTAAVAAGELVVVVVAADNIASGGDDNACSGVTLGVGGQALTKGLQIANAVAAQAGASSSLWYGIATSALASGGTIRATFGSGTLVDASGLTARHFSVATGRAVSVEGTPGSLVNNTGADPASLNVTTTNIACLRVRGIASQVGNNTNLTPTASWTAWANGNSATTGTTGEMCARAEHIISTATGAASDPTYVSAIYASVYVAFREGNLVLAAASNSYSLGGTAAALNQTHAGAAGSYSLTGNSADFYTGAGGAGDPAFQADAFQNDAFQTEEAGEVYTLTADGSGYALTGTAASFAPTYRLSGFAATFATTAGFTLAADGSSYSLTGSSAAFKLTHTAAGSSYALTGSSIALLLKHVAGSNSYALTGSAAGLKFGHVVGAGAYAITPATAGLSFGLVAGAGAYSLSGTPADFVTPPPAGVTVLSADAGSYALSGEAIVFGPAYRVSGFDAGFKFGEVVAAGSYSLTGFAASLTVSGNVVFPALAGSYALSGSSIGFALGHVAASSSYAITGFPVALATGFAAGGSSYALLGTDAQLVQAGSIVLTCGAGSYTLTGTSITISPPEQPSVGGGGGGRRYARRFRRKKHWRDELLELLKDVLPPDEVVTVPLPAPRIAPRPLAPTPSTTARQLDELLKYIGDELPPPELVLGQEEVLNLDRLLSTTSLLDVPRISSPPISPDDDDDEMAMLLTVLMM